jgi:protein-tyrosine-phosphatase
VGSAIHPDSALVPRGFGVQPADFRAPQLTAAMLVEAALTLAMSRAHRHDVLAIALRTLARTFTLREAADLLRLLDDELALPGKDLPERALSLVAELARARSRSQGPELGDVRDPRHIPVEVHEEVDEVIVQALLPSSMASRPWRCRGRWNTRTRPERRLPRRPPRRRGVQGGVTTRSQPPERLPIVGGCG